MTKLFFLILGRLEGLSFLSLLFVAMPLKYYMQQALGVKILGPAHGLLFLLYCSIALFLAVEEDWPLKKRILALAAAILPFGTFIFERLYLRARQDLKS